MSSQIRMTGNPTECQNPRLNLIRTAIRLTGRPTEVQDSRLIRTSTKIQLTGRPTELQNPRLIGTSTKLRLTGRPTEFQNPRLVRSTIRKPPKSPRLGQTYLGKTKNQDEKVSQSGELACITVGTQNRAITRKNRTYASRCLHQLKVGASGGDGELSCGFGFLNDTRPAGSTCYMCIGIS